MTAPNLAEHIRAARLAAGMSPSQADKLTRLTRRLARLVICGELDEAEAQTLTDAATLEAMRGTL